MVSVSGITNNVNTILSLIQRLEPAVAALPEVVGLVEAAISTFSNEDKHAVQEAYKAKMAKTDSDHEETQQELAQEAAQEPDPPSGD